MVRMGQGEGCCQICEDDGGELAWKHADVC